MPILNYTTKVPAENSIGQIAALLVKKGARNISSEYDAAGNRTEMSFVMIVGGLPVRYQLPANVAGVAAVMLKDDPWNSRRGKREEFEAKVREKAEWVAWRIIKDWIEAQMAMIESGLVEAAQIFMPYAMAHDGRTMYQLFVENNQKQLGNGGGNAQ